MVRYILFIVITTVIFFPAILWAQVMTDYCQMPSFLSTPLSPNVLLVIDTSGSMSRNSYSDGDRDSNGDGILDGYNPNLTYEGYFDPSKFYTQDASGIYVETTPTGQPCNKICERYMCRNWRIGDCSRPVPNPCGTRWFCCVSWRQEGDCNIQSGNYLNYKYMSRIDVLRWALTGGKPLSCHTLSIHQCDPELYPNSQLSCDSFGCILSSTNGVSVKAPWSRITGDSGGLLFQLKNLPLKPRIGAMFFDGYGVNRTVYIGDFTASSSFDGVNPYKNTIAAVNYEPPGGATPIAPALWDAYNYFAQLAPKFGGPQPQTGTGDKWKNPFYQCFDDNNDGNCQSNELRFIPCAKNFVILLTDGQWNVGGDPPSKFTCSIDNGVSSYDGGPGEQYSADPVVPAYWLHKKGFTNMPTGIQSYVENLYAIGLWLGGTGEHALKHVAMYGSFDRSIQWPHGTSGYPMNTCSPVDDCCYSANCGKGSSCTPLPPSHPTWDKIDMEGNPNPDGIPDTFFTAEDAVVIKNQMVKIVIDILRRVSAGTAVSILASGEGQGANLLQAVFYPQRSLGVNNTDISWTGTIQNLWYYLDPFFNLSTIREDTDKDKTLHLVNDYITNIYFDHSSGKTLASLCEDTDGDGDCDIPKPTINFEELRNLWDAGKNLFLKTPLERRIYTNYNGGSDFSLSLAVDPNFQSLLNATDETEARNIIQYVRGEDITGYRQRTVILNINDINITNTWKLSDIVHSTPRIQSWVPLNDYYDKYKDISYYKFINDMNEDGSPKATNIYRDRGMVYVGANDGMLHAFYLGKLKLINDPNNRNLKAMLEDFSSIYDPGDEVWAFIPRNALPYLKYLMDNNYCHLYYIDGSPYIFDASIGTTGCSEANYWNCPKTTYTWRTILIGSMNYGGACRNRDASCTDCVKTPVLNAGYSSYFALDITEQDNPILLWEFAGPDLGFSTTGPVIFRVGEQGKNGRWFVMFASGPTGPIRNNEFLGKSDQNLKLFILDLATGSLLSTIDTGISMAFGGFLFNTVLDLNDDYQDDVLYIPYSRWSGSDWIGGILRFNLMNIDINNPDFYNRWSRVIDVNGPITSGLAFLRSKTRHELWIYFGEGRFFYKTDDQLGRRRIYGIKEPCYSTTGNIDMSCTTTISETSLSDSTITEPSNINDGWYIRLDCAYGDTSGECPYNAPEGYAAERVVTIPFASPSGVVFFTTMSPTNDPCGYGGSTYIWAVNYRTGANPPTSALLGKVLLQLSTGEIREIELRSAFTERGIGGSGGRRSLGFFGIPPHGQGISAIVPSEPIRRFIFMRER